MATPTSACASAGASLVPSPVIATSRPSACSLLDVFELVLRRGLREEVIDAGFLCNRGGGQRVVAGDHDGADPHRPQRCEALLHTALDDVFEVDDPEHFAAIGNGQRRASVAGDAVRHISESDCGT